MEQNYVGELALHILETVRETFAAAGVSLPSTQVITLGGQTAQIDSEMLSVSLEQMYSGTPGNQAQDPVKCTAPKSASFAVELVRCSPVGAIRGRSTPLSTTEDTAQQTNVALARMQDMYLLQEAGMNACDATWFGSGIVDISAAPPNGGAQALVMSITTVVGGDYI